MHSKGLEQLRIMTSFADAQFHDDQWEAIEGLVIKRKRELVVQKTGWGKSAVYFIATKLLKEQRNGTALIISPLISLMRNQIQSAAKLDLNVVTYNSSLQKDEKQKIEQMIASGNADAVLIAPEQLGQSYFASQILPKISNTINLLVVDEAHCISVWGHDFRPDYQRIVRIVKNLPSNIPVLATTATANDLVINDIRSQLGQDLDVKRGDLTRKSLELHTLDLRTKEARLAWLANYLPSTTGTGIIYTKTTRDSEIVAQYLIKKGIKAAWYHSNLNDVENSREELEDRLLTNDLKVLVATSSLGMGFDKPDISFVIHYQAPSSIVEYYQQVGRAGRAIDHAIGILMVGKEDQRIQEFFNHSAIPKEKDVNALLRVLEEHDGLRISDIEPYVNFSISKIRQVIKYLSCEHKSPIINVEGVYMRTQYDYDYPAEKVARLIKLKEAEWYKLLEYYGYQGCLMQFLAKELDDPHAAPCGHCQNCDPAVKLDATISEDDRNHAATYLKTRYIPIEPRKTFASSGANAKAIYENYGFQTYSNKAYRIEPGLALSSWKDGAWGDLVAAGKQTNHFSDALIAPMVNMMNSIAYEQRPTWLTYVPSPRHPTLVKDFAHRLAKALSVECIDTVLVREVREPQKTMENDFHRCKNLDGAFTIDVSQGYATPVWLIDDAVDSRWTLTVIGALLRRGGATKVYPMALTSTANSTKADL
ncbi:RecQ family ATP-dependent DNA helicase [Pseudidiomarina terrestris]|uniref:RecQ family ATP-dependent DNA helicase n=1 Tax=Pseudidiomarina terrestris TaxID=2820060 RepID=UPI002656696D|nr:RecQ family ATP-dependent DNA helicase [Pseudidiomarina sp. 1ASP75-5]MDN7135367.1 RecQ family ATP-dependent DNA helicase [Pseudidiomarina sp. 1ASP75-5]